MSIDLGGAKGADECFFTKSHLSRNGDSSSFFKTGMSTSNRFQHSSLTTEKYNTSRLFIREQLLD